MDAPGRGPPGAFQPFPPASHPIGCKTEPGPRRKILLAVSADMTTPEVDLRDARLATEGDTRAFERLYRGHAARVHGLARRMVGHEEADELTQDVFVRVWEKLDTFRGEAAFGTWQAGDAFALTTDALAAHLLHTDPAAVLDVNDADAFAVFVADARAGGMRNDDVTLLRLRLC